MLNITMVKSGQFELNSEGEQYFCSKEKIRATEWYRRPLCCCTDGNTKLKLKPFRKPRQFQNVINILIKQVF